MIETKTSKLGIDIMGTQNPFYNRKFSVAVNQVYNENWRPTATNATPSFKLSEIYLASRAALWMLARGM